MSSNLSNPLAPLTPTPTPTTTQVITKYRLTVKPESTVILDLLFRPKYAGSHAFELPLTLAGISGVEGLQRVVAAEAIHPRLKLSSTVIKFGRKVVTPDHTRRFPYSMDFIMTNCDPNDRAIKWAFDDSKLQESEEGKVFSFEMKEGFLEPKDSEKITVHFLPTEAKTCEVEVPLYLDDKRVKAYLELSVKGTGVFPKLSFNKPYVLLPTVPLGVKSKATFFVKNTGYENLELQYRLPPSTAKLPLEISFPDGKTLGIAKSRLPVQLSFCSKKTLAFKENIEFMDTDGNKFTIPVIGATDNSLFTAAPFVVGQQADFGIYAKAAEAPSQLMPQKAIERLEHAAKKAAGQDVGATPEPHVGDEMEAAAAADDGHDDGHDEDDEHDDGQEEKGEDYADSDEEEMARARAERDQEQAAMAAEKEARAARRRERRMQKRYGKKPQLPDDVSDRSMSFLVRWMNATVLRAPIDKFPDDIISANGKQIFDVIEVLAGRNPLGKGSHKLTGDKKDYGTKLQAQYEKMLLFLKSRGALLHHIEAAYLLSKEQYAQIMGIEGQSGVTPAQAMAKRHRLEGEWVHFSRLAWTSTVYQIVRSLILPRINSKQFKMLPGVAGGPSPSPEGAAATGGSTRKRGADPSLGGSNIYTVAEGILLKWLSMHFAEAMGGTAADSGARRIYTFDKDLKDGAVLCAVLQSHVPLLTTPGHALNGYHRKPKGASQGETNVGKFISALQELGLDITVKPSDFAEINPRDMLLLVMFLYQNLPQFVPKAGVDFYGVLGEQIVKSIEMKNPTRKTINYRVILEGSTDFSIETTKLRLEPGEEGSFPISLNARFTKEVNGRISFRASKDGGQNAATMVFLLRSKIHSRKPVKTYEVDSPCYEAATTTMDVINPFNRDCTFEITCVQEKLLDPRMGGGGGGGGGKGKRRKKRGKRGRGGEGGRGRSDSSFASVDTMFPEPFFCKNTTVKVRSGEAAQLSIQFLPFMTGTYRCQFVLLDKEVGEMMYEVLGVATLPAPLASLSFATSINGPMGRVITVPSRQTQLDKAKLLATERLSGAAKTKARDDLKVHENLTHPRTVMEVAFDSPFFEANQIFDLVDSKDVRDLKAEIKELTGALMSADNSLAIRLKPNEPGDYTTKMLLSSRNELRVYEITCTVKARQVQKGLDFKAPVRQLITQEIPIVNSSNEDWTLRAQVSGSKDFKGSKSLTVPKGQKKNYTLQYQPMQVSDVEQKAQLTITNPANDEKYVFELTGQAEGPLAEEHVAITCQARDKVTHEFTVKNRNSDRAVDFVVETDLEHVSGDPSITVAPGSTETYVLNFKPLLGGTYHGSITFKDPDTQEIQWYTVEVQVDPPSEEDSLDLSAFVRQACSVEISLVNPLAEDVLFNVTMNGEGLIGPPNFHLGPSEAKVYELVYSPLLAGSQEGSVVFSSNLVGEVWYKLNLSAEEPPATILDKMSAAVGTRAVQTIKITNPSPDEIKLTGSCSNPRNFGLQPMTLTLARFETKEVNVVYSPSSLGTVEKSSVVFSNANYGNWRYEVSGTGRPPSVMDTIVVSCTIGEKASGNVNFRNPFPEPMEIDVELVLGDECFILLLEESSIQVGLTLVLLCPGVRGEKRCERHARLPLSSYGAGWRSYIPCHAM